MTRLFLTCSQGIEDLLAQEVKEIGYPNVQTGYRGVYVDVDDFSAVYRLNYHSRIATRVLLPLDTFRMFDEKSLYKGASRIDWCRYIPEGKTIAIDSNVNHKAIRNSHYAGLLVKDAICDQLRERRGFRPNIDTQAPDVQINLFVDGPLAVLSLDTSGAPLHKRGYRVESVEAPLHESLAAAMLRLARYDDSQVLIDPCCGSGTFLIEAAMMAFNIPPGFLRQKWGFMTHPEFSNSEWIKVKADAEALRKPARSKKFFGFDVNKSAVYAAKANIRAAGLQDAIQVSQADFRELTLTFEPTFLISNPPHGHRLDTFDHLKTLYRSLGDFMKQSIKKSGHGFIFTTNLDLAKEVGLAPTQRHVVYQSNAEGRLLEFEVF